MSDMHYTPYEEIERIWDLEQVKTVMAKHAYLYSGDQRRRELDELWVQSPEHRSTASQGYNNGFYCGMEEIARHYVLERFQHRQSQSRSFLENDPSLTPASALGLGIFNVHSANTPVIYVAEDGQTARYLAFDFGLYTAGKPDGDCDAFFTAGNVYCELCKEQGDWKIWHLILEHDHSIPVGQDYGDVPTVLRPGDDPAAEEAGTPPTARQLHDPMLGWEHLYQDMPKAYHTYDALHSYGPEGDHGMRYYERELRY